MRTKVLKQVHDKKLIAIVRGVKKNDCLKLAQALLDGGISMMEITFDQRSRENLRETTEAIAAISEAFGEKMFVGAGTVLNPEQVQMAADAGANYIISPDCKKDVIHKSLELGLVSMPGAFTPTEIAFAHDCGADFVKVFPSGNLGPEYIKAIRGPLPHIELLGVGGIQVENIPDFCKAGCAGFGVGGNLVNRNWIANGAFHRITDCAKAFCRAVEEV